MAVTGLPLLDYVAIAKTKSTASLRFALTDIKESLLLDAHFNSPYAIKLWAEWDAYIVEIQKRETSK